MRLTANKLVIEHFTKRKDIYLPKVAKDRFADRILGWSDKFPPNSKFLELGTGSGRLLEYLLQNGLKVEAYGVDFCRELIKGGKEKYKNDINLILADVRHLPFKEKEFDVVACRSLLHHLVGRSPKQNILKTFQEAVRVMKVKGMVFINEECMPHRFHSWMIFLGSYVLAKLNISVPNSEISDRGIFFFLTPQELCCLLTKSGIRVRQRIEKEWSMLPRYRLALFLSKTIHVQLTAQKVSSS